DAHGNVRLRAQGISTPLVNCNTFLPTAGVATYTAFSYDTYGNPLSVTDGRGNVTSYTYGSVGSTSNLYWTQRTVAQGSGIDQITGRSLEFNTGLVYAETDPNNILTSTIYDSPGRPISVSRAGVVTTMTYSDGLRYAIEQSDLNATGTLVKVQ